jgi:hypothetical protein
VVSSYLGLMLNREGQCPDLQTVQAIEIDRQRMSGEFAQQTSTQAQSTGVIGLKLFSQLPIDGFNDLTDVVM